MPEGGCDTVESPLWSSLFLMEKTHSGAAHERTAAHEKDSCWSSSWRTVSHG